jgi:transcriptional antiterminator Rof (Rho-off)
LITSEEGIGSPLNSKAEGILTALQGWVPELSGDNEIRDALERAFDYRGDITLTLSGGQRVEGYVFDRRSNSSNLEHCLVRLIPKDGNERVIVRYSDIVRLEFSGRDMAEGRTYQAWIKKYQEKKAQGEKNISLEPEPLD